MTRKTDGKGQRCWNGACESQVEPPLGRFFRPSSGTMSALSRDLRSSYRVLLRAAAASVLHQTAATSNLRKLYRPIFNEALKVSRTPASSERDTWFTEFNDRGRSQFSHLYRPFVG